MNRKEKYTKRRWPWLPKPGNGLLSTPMNTDSSATARHKTPEAILSGSTLHRQCSTLPLSHFIEIILNGDMSWLIISGTPTNAELLSAWEDILEEYASLIKTDKTENVFELYKKIVHTEWRLTFIEKSLLTLKMQYDEEVAGWVGEMGFGEVRYVADREEYLRSLYAIEMRAKMLIVLLNQYKAEYRLMNPERSQEDIVNNTRIRYEKEIASLSKYMGYRIVKEKTMVLEYAAIINNYLEDCRRSTKKEVPGGE